VISGKKFLKNPAAAPFHILSPETKNEKPETFPSSETLDESPEILDEAQAAELAVYLAEFPPYAKAQDPAPTVRRKNTRRAPAAQVHPAVTATAASPASQEPKISDAMEACPKPDSFITAHKRPASFPLSAAPGPKNSSSSDPSAPAPQLLLPAPAWCSRLLLTHVHIPYFLDPPEPKRPKADPPPPENRGYPRNNPPERPDHSRDVNFGNPGLFRSIIKNFC
jgi:hypothetical protein